MSISKLPSGRYRAQVYNPETGKNESVGKILRLEDPTFPNKREAKKAREKAREKLAEATGPKRTVEAWWTEWTTEEKWQRPKPSTNINRVSGTKPFVKRYGHLLLTQIDDEIVSEWEAEGTADSIKWLKTMFANAASREGGRLISVNPFYGISTGRSKGNAEKDPPSEDLVWQMIQWAYANVPIGFAAWLQVACFSGIRTGEMDALTWDDIDFDGGWIHVRQQFCSASHTFTLPKNGLARIVPMHEPVRKALMTVPRESEFCFVNGRRAHWTRAARGYQWNRVRKATGYTGTLYLATRHFAGSFMYNKPPFGLGLDCEDVAAALGHEDRGELVRRLYGHFRHEDALERVKRAFEQRGSGGLREVG